jgi:hypothetical protein
MQCGSTEVLDYVWTVNDPRLLSLGLLAQQAGRVVFECPYSLIIARSRRHGCAECLGTG